MITRSTVGKLMIEDALPEEMRGRNITFDKKNMSTLLKELADKHPDKYVDVTKKLSDIGRQVATETGGYSIGLSHLKQAAGTKKTINEIRQKLTGFLADTRLNDKQRNESIIRSVGGYQQSLMDDVYKEGLAAKNPIAMQIMSGSRGNKMNLSSLLGSDLLYEDHRGDIIPVPVLKSYSQGLTPAEYWAGTYGARKSIISTKFATADAGFFGKQLNQVTHRLSVVDQDDPRQDLAVRGLPVDTDDMDNEGALLAQDFGGYKRNTVLTPKILKDLKARDFSRILVRSPMTGGSPDGGVYARDVGVRERGTLPGRGEMVGMTAAQAIAEPISQGQLSAKHSGGVAGQEKTVGGFQYINQLIQVPKTFKGGAAHTTVDGRVQKIEDAPAGGKYVFINDKPQYVGSGFDLKVKLGDDVEAGDIISDGMPNPSIITEHKGIGEGRKYFVKAFRDSMGSMGLRSHRRNIELIGRGLIDHVRMTEEYGDHVPDDVIPYSTLEHGYKPREGFQTIEPSRALNKYLEKPVLHYSIGTKVRPGMLKDMQYFGVKDITVHDKPAPFQPEMVRAMYNLHHDPDWMTRMYGSGLKSSLLDATHRGSTSSATGTSFVPGLAKSVDFGRVGQVRQSEPGLKPDLNTPVATPMTPNTDTEKLSSDDILPGGIGDKYNVSDFPKKEMAKGVKTESEHTTNPAIAADISKDHLVEDPKYYTKLEKVEKKSAYSIADGIANVRRKDDTLSQLLEAKKHSDAKRYDHKNAILRKLMRQSPQDWVVDDADAKHYGVTHVPTSFKLHTDPNVIPPEVTRQKQAEVPPAVPAPAPATPAPAPNTNVYAAPPKPRRMFDNILPEVRPGVKGFLHNFKQTLGDVATLTNPRRSNLSSNWDFDAIGGSANSNRRQEYSSGSGYQASEPYAAPAPAAASAPAAAAPAPVTPAQPQTAAPAPVTPAQPQTAAPATPAQAQTAIPFDIERNAQTLEASRARQALPQINFPPISDSSVLDMMTRESFGDLASMYGYNRLAPMFSKAPAVAAAATAGAAVPAAVAATPISKLTSLLSHHPMLSSLKFLKSNPGTALALDIGTTEFANRSMKDTVLAQGRQMESYRDALARANDEYASNNMLDVGKAALNLGTFGLSSYLPGFAPTGAGVVASSGVMSALSPYSTAYRYLADKHIRDKLGHKGVSDFERQQAVDLAARENPMMREGLVAAGPPRDWAGWWRGDKPPETDYSAPQKYRTWQQWNPISNYIGNALRGIGVNSTWGRGEAEKIVHKNLSDKPEIREIQLKQRHIMDTRKMVLDLLMREDKTQASQLIANLYKDPESYAELKEKLPPFLMNQLEKLHAHNEIAATPAMVAAKAKQEELDQSRLEHAFGRPHPRFLPQPAGLLTEFSNYKPLSVPNPEQTAKDNESMQNAAVHARDILLNATQNPRALAAGEFDAPLKWLAQRGLINKDSNAISSDVKKRVAALVPKTEGLLPIPLKQFEAVPAAPETKVKAISRLDDKQFVEYARRMFDAVYPAPQTKDEPLSLLKGLQQINARNESLRELQSLPPELVEKLRKSYQEWQDYALPGPGRYNINEAPPTREATPNARMSQAIASRIDEIERRKREAARIGYSTPRPRK